MIKSVILIMKFAFFVRNIFTVSLVLFLTKSTSVSGQFPHQLLFNRFSTDQGLSQASVNCILRDSKGFMWFGTEDGLNRFDGNQFKVFRSKPNDSTSLRSNTILSLLEDSSGKLWVGTSDCISYYDRLKERFYSFPLPGRDFYIANHLEY